MFASLADGFAPAVFQTVATRSGDWSNPAIWSQGLPRNGQDVQIGRGVRVNVDGVIPGQFNFVNVQGTLSFDSNADTRLRVETLRVTNVGRLEVGTTASPIRANRSADIIFSTYRATDRRRDDDRMGFDADDNNRLGLGLLVEPTGQVVTAGDPKVAAVTSANNNATSRNSFRARSSSLVVTGNPRGWKVGDEIAIAPTRFRANNGNQTETARIRSITPLAQPIEGQRAFRIALGRVDNPNRPYQLIHDHRNIAGHATHVANLTRNIVFRTSTEGVNNGSLQRRGHVMSHSQDVRIRDAEFRDLGRTDKTRFVEDGRDGVRIRTSDGIESPVEVPGTRDGELNQRGRYALHFHRTLEVRQNNRFVNNWNNLAVVSGSVVNGSPGWGFVNHSSGVNFANNASVGVVGAAFVSQSGNEIGFFRSNVAIDGDGDGTAVTRTVEQAGRPIPERTIEAFRNFTRRTEGTAETIRNQHLASRHGDLGRTGEGFWLQSPGLIVTNNVAAGFDGRGFAIYNQGLFEPEGRGGQEVGFRQDLINWGDNQYRIWNDPGTRRHRRAVVQTLAFNSFDQNTAYASFVGLQTRFNQTNDRSFVQDFTDNTMIVGGSNATNAAGFELRNFTSIRNDTGFTTSYITNGRFTNFEIITDDPASAQFAILAQQIISGTARFNNLTIEGYRAGIDFRSAPVRFVLANPDIDLEGNFDGVVRYRPLRNNPRGITSLFSLGELRRTGRNFANV